MQSIHLCALVLFILPLYLEGISLGSLYNDDTYIRGFARAKHLGLHISPNNSTADLWFSDDRGHKHRYNNLQRNSVGMEGVEIFQSHQKHGILKREETYSAATFSQVLADGWVLVTQLEPGSYHILRVVHKPSEHIHIQPFIMAESFLNSSQAQELGEMLPNDHVLHRRSLLETEKNHENNNPEGATCGALRLDTQGQQAMRFAVLNASAMPEAMQHAQKMANTSNAPLHNFKIRPTTDSSRGRRSLAYSHDIYQNPPKYWSGCYPGMEDVHFAKVGIVADAGFVDAFQGSEDITLRAIEAIVAATNMVYHFQVHIQLEITQILLVTDKLPKGPSNSSFLSYLEASPSLSLGTSCVSASDCVCSLLDGNLTSCTDNSMICGIVQPLQAMTSLSYTLSSQSTTFTSPSSSASSSSSVIFPTTNTTTNSRSSTSHLASALSSAGLSPQAHWHLLTDCFSPPGVVGIAWTLTPDDDQPRRGTICNSFGLNAAVTSRSATTWQTFAHEVGHSFGLSHSFEEGQGLTGGIMDYGNPKYDERIQFNELYRREELCEELSLMKSLDECPTLFAPSSANCFEIAPYDNSQLGANLSRGYYCAGGFCPTKSDGSPGPCRPPPPVLTFREEPLNFTETRIGLGLSGYGNPEIMKWHELNGTACSEADLEGVQYNQSDLVLVQRGGCSFDVKASVMAAIGTGGLVVFDSNVTLSSLGDDSMTSTTSGGAEELLEMYGDLVYLPIKMAYISHFDARRISMSIRTSNSSVFGYLGAAPPHILSLVVQSENSESAITNQSSTKNDNPPSRLSLILIAIICCVTFLFLSSGVFLIWYRHQVSQASSANEPIDFVQAYHGGELGSVKCKGQASARRVVGGHSEICTTQYQDDIL